MCGIAGIFSPVSSPGSWHGYIHSMTESLSQRGPDNQGIFQDQGISLGHRRLSIIDTSDAANQPFSDASGNLIMVFNGEIFNYRELRTELESAGKSFRTDSDTEVLIELFSLKGRECLQMLNGFFAFAVYNKSEHSLFLARDRYGVKPLSYLISDEGIAFASEVKAILKLPVKREINRVGLVQYLHLNYLPPNKSMVKGIQKIPPGHFLKYPADKETDSWYSLKITTENDGPLSYTDSCQSFKTLLRDAVKIRLRSDVPLGSFLSGGIDSSVISAIAKQENGSLETFSIGFEDEPAFDETSYAELLAKKWQTTHTTFRLKKDDLLNELFNVLDYFDEPFADSSALAVYILSKKVKTRVSVALSGDGADEMLGGYNKHTAEFRLQKSLALRKLSSSLAPLFHVLPKSRNSSFGNLNRKLFKLSRIAGLKAQERYWISAGFYDEIPSNLLLNSLSIDELNEFEIDKKNILKNISDLSPAMNQIFKTDMELVLPGDMLVKVDRMSMANSLEVRNPFLDFRVVNHVMSQPEAFKIDKHRRKKMLTDSFGELLPTELLQRGKMGFEVPLLNWFRKDLKFLIEDDLLSENFIKEQGVFQFKPISMLIGRLHSSNPDDSVAKIWALLVFQHWWKKNILP
ncbi:MAG: hypothetical protein RLZZ46_1497 [Bacteroidota bacterium]